LEKFNNSCSSKCLANSCKPNGKPLLLLPVGKEIAGAPVNDACTVKISERYVTTGSFSTFPIANAGSGTVGRRIKSYSFKIALVFSLISCVLFVL
jgi:hypothetical protein